MSEDNKQTDEGKATDSQPEIKPPVVTQHTATVDGNTLPYTVTTGMMPLTNDEGEIEAQVFFMAYTLDGVTEPAERPLTFAYNGGPGSSSIWLHMGGLAPKRVAMLDDGSLPPPPYKLVNNPHSWLPFTDLVFIDPVGTGYSRATKPDLNKKFWGVQGDLDSVAEVIRLYLSRYGRWTSPLFMAGESYGTTRAAGLAGKLIDMGVAFNGILLISTVLQMNTIRFVFGHDLPYALYLPTYTATAWYHKKLAPELQQRELRDLLSEVEKWVTDEYQRALFKGDSLSDEERQALVSQIAAYTGLSTTFIDHNNLRVPGSRFFKELLRDEKRSAGRLDSRFRGIDALPAGDSPDHDPSYSSIIPPYTATFNDYVRRTLGYETDAEYRVLSFEVNQNWDWGSAGGGFTDTSNALRSATAKNPYLKLFVALGYYDLATPYFAAKYTLDHMNLEPSLRANVRFADYEAGHMMYIHLPSLEKLGRDVREFYDFALA